MPKTASSATLQVSSILIFCHKRALFFRPLLLSQSPNLPSVFSDCCIFCSELISASAWFKPRCAWFCCWRKSLMLACSAASSSRNFCTIASIAAMLCCACVKAFSLVFNCAASGNIKLAKLACNRSIRCALSAIFCLINPILLLSSCMRWLAVIKAFWLLCAVSLAVFSALALSGSVCLSASSANWEACSFSVAACSSIVNCAKFCVKVALVLALRSKFCNNCASCCAMRSRASAFCLTWFSRLETSAFAS